MSELLNKLLGLPYNKQYGGKDNDTTPTTKEQSTAQGDESHNQPPEQLPSTPTQQPDELEPKNNETKEEKQEMLTNQEQDDKEQEQEQEQEQLVNVTPVLYSDPSVPSLYTLRAGTILYHGSYHKRSFNPFNIQLGEDNLIAYFTPNPEIAQAHIGNCVQFPVKKGYVHKFKLSKDIERIIIVSPHEKEDNWTLKYMEKKFCNATPTDRYNGVGFFYEKDENGLQSEFMICNPKEYLDYIDTQDCIAPRKLSEPRPFNI